MSSANIDASRKIDNEFVRLFFFNVGHGASTLISMPPAKTGSERRYGVVDCKDLPGISFVEKYLLSPPFKDEPACEKPFVLEFVALTHFDTDHFTGMSRLLGGPGSPFTVRRFLGPPCYPIKVANTKYKPRGARYQELYAIHELAYEPTRRAVRLGKAPILDIFLLNQRYDWFRDINIEIMGLAPVADAVIDEKTLARGGNPSSGALRLRFKTKHVQILGGDVEKEDWEEIQQRLNGNPQDLLKANSIGVPHHGGRGNPREVWDRFSRRMQKDVWMDKWKLRKPSEAVVSCGINDPFTRRESYKIFLQTKCIISCTNPSKFCKELLARQNSKPPCISINDKKIVIDPLEKFRCAESITRDVEENLKPYAAPPQDVFDGCISVTLREKRRPKVKYFNRKPCKLTLKKIKEYESRKNS